MEDRTLQTRDRILRAAMTRFKHYGYGKTTMAEIAADCDMSPGNIYRFFPAKIDLAEAMARMHHAEQNETLAEIARRSDLAPDARLRELLFYRMRANFKLVETNSKTMEIAEVLKRERPLHHNEVLAQERVFLSALLEEAAEIGLFRYGDFNVLAEMMQAAVMKFSFPGLFSHLTLPKLERELDGVLDLIFNGLYAR